MLYVLFHYKTENSENKMLVTNESISIQLIRINLTVYTFFEKRF